MTRRHVALCVIARDEASRIARLLDSVAPWVDTMLVLDAGSCDDTSAIARRCGARVETFAWCDDFSAARNAALELMPADWHLVLDADEWLIAGGEALRALRDTPPNFVGALQLIDHTQTREAALVHSWLSRVLPGTLRYAGRVHEQPQHSLPVRRLPLQVGHDGYTPLRLAAKRGRNRHLLQAELAEHREDAYCWYQLGKDHDVYGEHPDAVQAFFQADTLCTGTEPWRFDLATRPLFALKKAGRHDEGLQQAQASLERCAGSPDFHFALGDLLLDWATSDPARGAELLPMAQSAWTRCLEIGERPDLSGSVQGRGSYLAAHNLAVILECLGLTAEGALLRGRYPVPDASSVQALLTLLGDLR